ncbi:biotin--[acetyl-CoA-carboxylase] ligase [Pseudomonas sp. HMWF010]|uniref:biotin--[acetyl-CoA-carboxylase] ligase n=1 Tax=Caulobacter sp. HMWF009 TaxID=2056846 RepID=UPI000D357246|nr:biotin--[acetyl-CoA-carboxylase] ligase [Caulobacter sp. HMWF009]PTS89218.1 biotin--[acetyl-CoA-carboxylase] ligase [Caulobacter sp. HMWF009]PTT79109.1 biotin--[acetyl-CoA-carboxylase] ligase [Pseudomonas sp. HMWF010]
MTGESRSRSGPPVVIFDEIDSTNAEARRRAEAGEEGPVWLLGLRQTSGRGRRGRAWETGQGNLAATLLFRTEKPAAEAAQVSFVAALAVADLLDLYVPAHLVSLKWPNDPLIGGLKASGILVESGSSALGGLWIAVGIGVNLVQGPAASERPATSVMAHSATAVPSPPLALQALADAFARWQGVWEQVGFPAIAQAWTERAYGLGEACVARLGHETVEGIAEGLDTDGSLRLRLVDGSVRRISAGDVFFGEAG